MRSDKKLTHYRGGQYSGPKRGKPPVRKMNRAIRARVKDEHELVQAILRDAHLRRSMFSVPGTPLAAYTVYQDFAHSEDYTEVDQKRLPRWNAIGEYLKLHLFLQVGLEDGGYSFNANVRPDLEAAWLAKGIDPIDRIKRLVNAALKAEDLDDVEYSYVVEGRAKDGARSTKLHIHGIFLTQQPAVATRFKIALERAIGFPPKQKGTSAPGLRRQRQVPNPKPLYDVGDGTGRGYNRWGTYITKNAVKIERRFGMRRIHVSRSATQVTRELWALIRGDA